MSNQRRLVLALALAAAMVLPTCVTWLYFLVLATNPSTQNPAQQIVYGVGKIAQLLWPLVVVWCLFGRLPVPGRPRGDGMLVGIGFGLLVAGVMLALYYLWLADSPILGATPQRVREKVTQLGFTSPLLYLGLAACYTVGHSLFEEYYFRWFIFGHLRTLLPFLPAVILSSVAFMAHHIILLYFFLPRYFFVAALPFALAIAVGGVFWAWLYERTGTLYPAWVSHGIVDAAIFVLGWILLQR